MKSELNFPEYSLVALLPTKQSWRIKGYKQKLGSEINKFKGYNTEPHVTVAEFWNLIELEHYIHRLRTFCRLVCPIDVVFNRFVFGTETFFIGPDDLSKRHINQIIRDLHFHIDKKGHKPSAHISIARQIQPHQMKAGFEMFKDIEVDIRFLFGSLYLRKFRLETKQYSEIIEVFPFSGKPLPTLFEI